MHADPGSAQRHAGSNVPETTQACDLETLSHAQRRPRPFLEWEKAKGSQYSDRKSKITAELLLATRRGGVQDFLACAGAALRVAGLAAATMGSGAAAGSSSWRSCLVYCTVLS
jgi:hypothetical protein